VYLCLFVFQNDVESPGTFLVIGVCLFVLAPNMWHYSKPSILKNAL
jgi:hypothetical protein